MKSLAYLLGVALMAAIAAATPGAIWTTNGDCGDEQQDVNHFAIGEHVFINGANFDEGTEAWDITGLPGGASCDPDIAVASGDVLIGETGAFCFDAYTVAADDCGEYKATVGNKHDNYRVDNPIPEFGIVAASVATLGAIGGFLFLRKRK